MHPTNVEVEIATSLVHFVDVITSKYSGKFIYFICFLWVKYLFPEKEI